MLIENINILTARFPRTYQALKAVEKNLVEKKVIVELARNHLPTLSVQQGDKSLYIHSKYDPVQEGEKFVEQFKEAGKYKHIFFYGVGLGYHIKAFLRQHPDVEFTLFEPNPEILLTFLAKKELSELPIKNLKNIYAETSPEETTSFLIDFANFLLDEVLFVSLPSYERIFAEHYQNFITLFRNILKNKKYSLNANRFYEKKWTINCLKNFPKVVGTPNFFDNREKYFQGKPALIVAAGPSVEEEIENLRFIKEHGLAYIFAAGSGLHPLLNHGIIPDAACSYDPNDNTVVFKPLIEQGIDTVPLIFGSFIGFSRFNEYPGPKFHIIVSQDTIAPYYLQKKNGRDLQVIIDSPTISGIILQILAKIGCAPIIFVGQNLAYKDDQRYASGINYYNPKAGKKDLKNSSFVEDVYGGQVLSNDTFILMKGHLEYLIRNYISDHELINTTKGGAKITGTKFIPLEDLIKERLRKKVVDSSWVAEQEVCYETEYMVKQGKEMDNHLHFFEKSITSIKRVFTQMEGLIAKGNTPQLEKTFTQFDKELKKFTDNQFYQVFIAPMKRVELELIAKMIDKIKYEKDPVAKAQRIIKELGGFIIGCQRDYALVKPFYNHLKQTIRGKEQTAEMKTG